MSGRRWRRWRWLAMTYGPAAVVVIGGVFLTLWSDLPLWFGFVYVLFGVVIGATAGRSVALYRSGYYRGRRDCLSPPRGVVLHEPNPWDEGA